MQRKAVLVSLGALLILISTGLGLGWKDSNSRLVETQQSILEQAATITDQAATIQTQDATITDQEATITDKIDTIQTQDIKIKELTLSLHTVQGEVSTAKASQQKNSARPSQRSGGTTVI